MTNTKHEPEVVASAFFSLVSHSTYVEAYRWDLRSWFTPRPGIGRRRLWSTEGNRWLGFGGYLGSREVLALVVFWWIGVFIVVKEHRKLIRRL